MKTIIDENWYATKGSERYAVTFDTKIIRQSIQELTPPFDLPAGYEAIKTEGLERYVFKICKVETPQPEEKKDEHCELPNANYKYGEPYNSGVRPVYGANQQLLWYSVPNSRTRFMDLDEAENIQFIKLELAELRAEHLKYKDAVEVLTFELNKASAERDALEYSHRDLVIERDKLNTRLEKETFHAQYFKSEIMKFQAENERLKELIGNTLANYQQYGQLSSDVEDRLKSYLENK